MVGEDAYSGGEVGAGDDDFGDDETVVTLSCFPDGALTEFNALSLSGLEDPPSASFGCPPASGARRRMGTSGHAHAGPHETPSVDPGIGCVRSVGDRRLAQPQCEFADP